MLGFCLMLPPFIAGVTPGQGNVDASLAGMGIYAHVPARSTRTGRVAATTAIVRMMPSVRQSMERASVQLVRTHLMYEVKQSGTCDCIWGISYRSVEQKTKQAP
jgi:hypothetical protein